MKLDNIIAQQAEENKKQAEISLKIQELENSNKTNYLQKDDSYHMLWTLMCSFFLQKHLLCVMIKLYIIYIRKVGTINVKTKDNR